MWNEKIVYIGSKPLMNYVIAVSNIFSHNNCNEVVLKARGRAISTAVDVAEVTKRILLKDLEFDVKIGTEQLPRDEGGTRNVSTMEITLNKSSTGEVENEEKETPEPSDTAGKPETPASVDEPTPEEAPAPLQEKEITSDLKQEDEETEEKKNGSDQECG